MGHGPWSLWVLAAGALLFWPPDVRYLELWIIGSAIVPAAWTAGIVAAFCRTVLDDSRRRPGAARRCTRR